MEALKRKWNSRRGASILLALLFLLVCMMAGASVLMAAASNAGKLRSNKEEQQKYLTLISALQLLCDELESVKYMGRYTYAVEQQSRALVDADGDPLTDAAGNVITVTDTTRIYTQRTGELQKREDGKLTTDDWAAASHNLQAILPLFNDWDSVFAEQFDRPTAAAGSEEIGWTVTRYGKDANIPASLTESYTLTLTVSGDKSGLTETVEVTVSGLNQAGTIILRATLGDLVVRATLVATDNKGPNKLEPENDNSNTYALTATQDLGGGHTITTYYYRTRSVTWKLDEIVKDGGGA